jgi:hypothetical protein
MLNHDLDQYILQYMNRESIIALLQTNRGLYNAVKTSRYYKYLKGSKEEAILKASRMGDLAIIQWFHDIEKYHDVNQDILQLAAAYGHLKIVEYLLSAQPQLNHDDPFIIACDRGYLEIAQSLDKASIEARQIAFMCERLEIMKWMSAHYDINSTWIINAFHQTCKSGNLEVAQWLYTLEPINYWEHFIVDV